MIDKIRKDCLDRMDKTRQALKNTLSNIRAGRAHPGLLDQIQVEYYGAMTPINQVASVVVEDSRTLRVTPWEKDMSAVIEKAITVSDLDLNPNSVGGIIRVPLPTLTEQRRESLVKLVKDEGEKAKIAVRNIRRDANSNFKEMLKDKNISEDEARGAEENMQKLTDDNTKYIDELITSKEVQLKEI